MLISVTIENWRSIKEPITLHMGAGRERQHRERLAHLKKYRTNILPVSAIYGANASGKSNLFKALRFARAYIVDGPENEKTTGREAFLLESEYTNLPTKFSFQILVEETIYEYIFAITRNNVVEEKLVKIYSTKEEVLFCRTENNVFEFKKHLTKDEKKVYEIISEGTSDNKLFVTNMVQQKREDFKNIYDWFEGNLILISPDSSYGGSFFDGTEPLSSKINQWLPQLDVGAIKLERETTNLASLPLPERIKKGFLNNRINELGEGERIAIGNDFEIIKENEQTKVFKTVACHQNNLGEDVLIDIREESDGTLRLLDLLPAFVRLLEENDKVMVIDELDRSLHTQMSYALLEKYLSDCLNKDSRKQLIFTTHDVSLMTQDLFRRDELWLMERDAETGASRLLSISEFDERYDKNIARAYLQGRFGSIPRIFLNSLAPDCEGIV